MIRNIETNNAYLQFEFQHMLQQFNDNEEFQLEIQDIAKDLLLYSLDAFKFSLKLITNETLQEKWRRRMICTKENTKFHITLQNCLSERFKQLLGPVQKISSPAIQAISPNKKSWKYRSKKTVYFVFWKLGNPTFIHILFHLPYKATLNLKYMTISA